MNNGDRGGREKTLHKHTFIVFYYALLKWNKSCMGKTGGEKKTTTISPSMRGCYFYLLFIVFVFEKLSIYRMILNTASKNILMQIEAIEIINNNNCNFSARKIKKGRFSHSHAAFSGLFTLRGARGQERILLDCKGEHT